jgi:hypothetical protein
MCSMIDPTKIIDGLMGAANVLRAADKIPEYEAVLDAYGQIAELQAKSYGQQLEIQRLATEIEQIRTSQKSAEGSQIWADHLWLVNDHQPYCLHCYEKNKRLFHVVQIRKERMGTLNQCPECRSEYRLTHRSYWAALAEQKS